MYLNLRHTSSSVSYSDPDLVEDVVSSFCESLDSILRSNFKPNVNPDEKQKDSGNKIGSDPSTTKNQKLAAIFCRQWLSGMLSSLLPNLNSESKVNGHAPSLSVPSEPQFVEDRIDFQDLDELGVCVENAKVFQSNGIEVTYSPVLRDGNNHLKPKMRAQELMELILKGKREEWSLHRHLENFWRTSPGLILQLISNRPRQEQDEPASQTSHSPLETVSLDNEALDFLDHLLSGDLNWSNDLEDYLSNNPKVLVDRANKLGIVGVDRLVELFNKLKREVNHVNKMAKFFTKFAVELSSSSQVEII